MKHEEDGVKIAESLVQEESEKIQQNRNILEEIKIANDEMKNPRFETYNKTRYWNQQDTTKENANIVVLLEEMKESIARLEYRLTNIETLLKK